MIVAAFIIFLFGIVIGSFLNVVIYRTLHDESPLEGRSKCDLCKKQIAWYDNIPLLSYIVLAGKCRYCKKPISINHPVIELMTGVMFVWWYVLGLSFFFKLQQPPFQYIQPAFWLLVGVLLIIIFFSDIFWYIIPDYAVLLLTILALSYRIGLTVSGIMQVKDFGLSILAGAIASTFFFILWFVTKGKGMGFGDVKFVFPMGILLGWQKTLVGIFMAFILGSLVAVILMAMKKKTMKQIIPFGPFLVAGCLVGLVWGEKILQWYLGLL